MAKFSGMIGFIETKQTQPGYWEPCATEKKYYGDITRNINRYQNTNKINDDITISNVISIVADPYANKNFQYIKYVKWMGSKWTVTNIEVAHPRLILSLGGMYNGTE